MEVLKESRRGSKLSKKHMVTMKSAKLSGMKGALRTLPTHTHICISKCAYVLGWTFQISVSVMGNFTLCLKKKSSCIDESEFSIISET